MNQQLVTDSRDSGLTTADIARANQPTTRDADLTADQDASVRAANRDPMSRNQLFADDQTDVQAERFEAGKAGFASQPDRTSRPAVNQDIANGARTNANGAAGVTDYS